MANARRVQRIPARSRRGQRDRASVPAVAGPRARAGNDWWTSSGRRRPRAGKPTTRPAAIRRTPARRPPVRIWGSGPGAGPKGPRGPGKPSGAGRPPGSGRRFRARADLPVPADLRARVDRPVPGDRPGPAGRPVRGAATWRRRGVRATRLRVDSAGPPWTEGPAAWRKPAGLTAPRPGRATPWWAASGRATAGAARPAGNGRRSENQAEGSTGEAEGGRDDRARHPVQAEGRPGGRRSARKFSHRCRRLPRRSRPFGGSASGGAYATGCPATSRRCRRTSNISC